MPKPSLRTRSKKRRHIRTSGGRAETHFRKEKTGASRCSRCGGALFGLPRSSPSKLHKLSASQRKVERVYGGHLCHSCLKDLLKQAARNI